MGKTKTDTENKKVFQNSWLEEDIFKDYLASVKGDVHSFRCKACQRTLSLSTSGRSAVKEHFEGQKHEKIVAQRANFFSKSTQQAITVCLNRTASTSSASANPQPTLDHLIEQTGVTTAEILWTLQAVMSGYSINSCDDVVELFTKMFPDSDIAKKMKLGRTKIGYIINYGLGPYFKKVMIQSIELSPIYCLSFDESLSDATQRSKMVVMIRYWDEELLNARVQYLGSSFFGHARNEDLLRERLFVTWTRKKTIKFLWLVQTLTYCSIKKL